MVRSTGAILLVMVPNISIMSLCRGLKRMASAPKRLRSNFEAIMLMNSMAQQATPKGMGHKLFFRPQLTTVSRRVVSTASLMFASAMSALPLEGALAPGIDEAHQQGGHEAQHGAEGPEGVLEVHGPWEKEGRFHVEQDEEHGREIELHGVLVPSAGLKGRHTAFVGPQLGLPGIVRLPPGQDPAREHEDGGGRHGGDQQQDQDRQEGRCGMGHGALGRRFPRGSSLASFESLVAMSRSRASRSCYSGIESHSQRGRWTDPGDP